MGKVLGSAWPCTSSFPPSRHCRTKVAAHWGATTCTSTSVAAAPAQGAQQLPGRARGLTAVGRWAQAAWCCPRETQARCSVLCHGHQTSLDGQQPSAQCPPSDSVSLCSALAGVLHENNVSESGRVSFGYFGYRMRTCTAQTPEKADANCWTALLQPDHSERKTSGVGGHGDCGCTRHTKRTVREPR